MPALLRGEKRGQRGRPTGWGFIPIIDAQQAGQGSRRDGEGEQGGRRSELRGPRAAERSRRTYSRK